MKEKKKLPELQTQRINNDQIIINGQISIWKFILKKVIMKYTYSGVESEFSSEPVVRSFQISYNVFWLLRGSGLGIWEDI